MIPQNDVHNVLWTGGWDSTFRVLDVAIREKRVVQPYYLSIPWRVSLQCELSTQELIKDKLNKIAPDARNRIQNTIVTDLSSVPKDSRISKSVDRLKRDSFIGDQYERLSRFSEHMDLYDLELSVHVDDKVFHHLAADVEFVDGRYVLKEELSRPELEIFRRFSFPLLKLSKLDMEQIARSFGFSELLDLTWFCYTPDPKGRPCGTCNPCVYTIQEGLGRRVPWQGHVRRAKRSIKNRIKAALNL